MSLRGPGGPMQMASEGEGAFKVCPWHAFRGMAPGSWSLAYIGLLACVMLLCVHRRQSSNQRDNGAARDCTWHGAESVEAAVAVLNDL